MGLLATLGLKPRPPRPQEARAPDARGDEDGPAVVAKPPPKQADPSPGGDGASTAAPPQKAPASDYEAKRDAARQLLDALKKHKQKAHVAAEIATATAHLAAAKSHADKKDTAKALASVEEARKTCVAAKGFADKYAAYMAKRADAMLALNSAKLSGWNLPAADAKVTAADTKAGPPGRNYAGATTDVDAVVADIAKDFKDYYVDGVTAKIAALKAHKAAAFVDREVKRIDALQAQVAAAIPAKAWRRAVLAAREVGAIFDTPGGLLADATRIADRRIVFDEQRVKTVAAVDKVKARAALAPLKPGVEQSLAQADALASRAQMQIDDGVRALNALEVRCQSLQDLADNAQAYATERQAAESALAALDKHAAAGKVAAECAAIRKLLASAASLAGDASGSPAGTLTADAAKHDHRAARNVLRQASSDIAAATQVADGLAGVVAAEKNAADPKKITQAVADLRKDAAALAKDPNAALAKQELANAEAALVEVEKKIAGKQPEVAAQVLIGASLELVKARKLQVEHARFVETQAKLEARAKALAARPVAKAVAAKIDALKAALANAAKHDKAAAWPEAMAALRAAEQAADQAEQAANAREIFDARAEAAKKLVADAKYKDIKSDQEKSLKQAHADADAFDFAAATRNLQALENRIEVVNVQKLAKGGAVNADGLKKIAQSCAQMMGKGGAKQVDELIKSLPDTVDKSVLETLAKERFKLEVVADAGPGAQAALKKMCELMALVPPDVVTGNPSLKKVSRVSGGGAFYRQSENLVVMNSRPGSGDKADFGYGATDRLPAREKDYEPANDAKEDLFRFNMLHELAHAIDDANNFMASREDDAAFGGWRSHGDVQPIAEAVARVKFKGKARPEDVRYVLDRISVGASAVAPEPPAGDAAAVAAWKQAVQDVDDWHTGATTDGVWSNHAQSMAIEIDKRIYHQAYSNTWVSYLAAARARGITGYQFRAPGEWFSELYAAYKVKKLKEGHPSAGWLSKLSI